jgi:hypothetical protein
MKQRLWFWGAALVLGWGLPKDADAEDRSAAAVQPPTVHTRVAGETLRIHVAGKGAVAPSPETRDRLDEQVGQTSMKP